MPTDDGLRAARRARLRQVVFQEQATDEEIAIDRDLRAHEQGHEDEDGYQRSPEG